MAWLLLLWSAVTLALYAEQPGENKPYRYTRQNFPDSLLINLQLTDPDSAITLARECLGDALEQGDNVFISAVYIRMGSIYFHKNNFVASLEAYSNALPYTHASGDKSRIAHLQIYIGNVYYHQQMYQEARGFYLEAEENFFLDDDTLGLPVALNNLGLCAKNLGDLSAAEAFFRQAMTYREMIGSTYLLVHSYGYLLDLARLQGDVAKGKKLVAVIDSLIRLKPYSSAAEIDVVAEALRKCGQLYASAGEYSTAAAWFVRALQAGNPNDNNFSALLTLDLARAANATRDVSGSIGLAEKSARLAAKGANTALQQEATSFLAALYEQTGNPAKALAYTKEVLRLQQNADAAAVRSQLFDYLLFVKGSEMSALLSAKQRELNAEQEKNKIVRQNSYLLGAALLILAVFLLYAAKTVRRQRRMNAELLRRNTEVSAQRAEIKGQKEHIEEMLVELRRVNRSRDKLYSVFVHDLKNPLHNLLVLAELMVKDFPEMAAAEQQTYIHHVQASAERLNSLLMDMLKWLQLQLGKTEVAIAPVAPRAVSEHASGMLLASASEKGITIINNIPAAIVVHADKTSLDSIFYNLLHNAIKFSNPGGFITLDAVVEAESVLLSVRDTGVGFDGSLLDKFRNAEIIPSGNGTAGETGTGFGLMIIRDLLALNKGSIALESKPGEGSTFTLHLRRVEDAA